MRIYELIYIIKPDLPEEETEKTVALVKEVIESGGGTIDKVDQWGKRRMAYKVQKYQDGYYVLVQYSLDEEESAALPKEVERRLGVNDAVIKFMTIRIDEDLKRVAKLKAAREKRTSRRPAAAPGRPAVAAAGGSGGSPTPGSPSSDDASE